MTTLTEQVISLTQRVYRLEQLMKAGDAQPEHASVTTGSVEATGESKRHDSSGTARGGDIADEVSSDSG